MRTVIAEIGSLFFDMFMMCCLSLGVVAGIMWLTGETPRRPTTWKSHEVTWKH